VELTLVAGECPDGVTCPAVYLTDHGTLVIQGIRVVDQQTLDGLRLGPGEAAVEVPADLLRELTGRADRG